MFYILCQNTFKVRKEGCKIKNTVEPIRSRVKIRLVEQYLAQTSIRDKLIFDLGINSGLRVSDILGLDVKDVKNKTHVEIKEKKTGKYKRFPLNRKMTKLLKEYTRECEIEDPLFMSIRNKRLDRSQVYRKINEACRAVGIGGNIGTHTMRKSFGYHHYKKYKDVAMLQLIFNHSTPNITLRYIGIDQDEIDDSYKHFEL